LPKVFSKVHPKYGTPSFSTILTGFVVAIPALFANMDLMVDLTSIGTLFAFVLVCIGVLVLRKTQPDAPRVFRTPMVPLVPILGVLFCVFMMASLPFDTWLRLMAWMAVGIGIYFWYGAKNAKF